MGSLFLKLINLSITASWLALAVILIRFAFKKAPKWVMGLLWAFVGLRLVFPFSVESVFSLIPSKNTLPADILVSDTPYIDSGFESFNQIVNPYIGEVFSPAVENSVNPMQILAFVLSIVWLVGMTLMLIYTGISYLKLRKQVAEAVLEQNNIWISDNIGTPFILGVFNPRIYLPSNLSEEDRRYVIAHENAHLSRRDHIWKPLGFVLLAVYWFNPIMWVAYVMLCKDIEIACDERVIRKEGVAIKKPYTNALINCSVSRKTIAACPLAFGETGVKDRIKGVLYYKKPTALVALATAVTVVVTAVCFLTNPVAKADAPEIPDIPAVSESGDVSKEPIATPVKGIEFDKYFGNYVSYFMQPYEQGDEMYLPRPLALVCEYIYIFREDFDFATQVYEPNVRNELHVEGEKFREIAKVLYGDGFDVLEYQNSDRIAGVAYYDSETDTYKIRLNSNWPWGGGPGLTYYRIKPGTEPIVTETETEVIITATITDEDEKYGPIGGSADEVTYDYRFKKVIHDGIQHYQIISVTPAATENDGHEHSWIAYSPTVSGYKTVPIKGYKCLACGFITESSDEIQAHSNTVHDNHCYKTDGHYRCCGCRFEADSIEEMEKHLEDNGGASHISFYPYSANQVIGTRKGYFETETGEHGYLCTKCRAFRED